MNPFKELGIVKDHFYFRMIKRTRQLTIHTECLHKENVWEAAQRYVDAGNKAIWYVVTPVNFDFVHAESGCRLSRQAWEKTILKRYKWLEAHGQRIEAHVHLRVKMHMYDSSEERRKEVKHKITGAAAWLRKNGFRPEKIVFGWWSFNDFALETARRLGLEPTRRLDYYFIHDYDLL